MADTEPGGEQARSYRYAAFISYSSKDATFAKRLHRALEAYGIPSSLGRFDILGRGGKPNRIYPVFRDREELPAGELASRIEQALSDSRSMIVVCSPNAAASPWVEREIEAFVAMGRKERVFAIIADKAPLVDANGADATAQCFPSALRGDGLAGPDAFEPIAADARAARDGFRNAWLKLVAGMIGVNAGALQDRDRRRRRRAWAQNALVAAALMTAVATAWFTQASWQSALRQYWRYTRYVSSDQQLARLAPGQSFQDCAPGSNDCPPMVVVPAGSFLMGSADTAAGAKPDEQPVHKVSIDRFAVSKFDVTFEDWRACVDAGGCGDNRSPDPAGWTDKNLPVFHVDWTDAQEYVAWLSKMTGQRYRLLSESEWEYAARAGGTTEYPWGDSIGSGKANCDQCGGAWNGRQPSPVGSLPANAFGLYDMSGDVWQWVQDCYHPSYAQAPTDGAAWDEPACASRVLRGGSWASDPEFLRSADRASFYPTYRDINVGFRVARTLPPAR
jgi:formylglycine-generating enzyme required for sulfatase activity